MPTTHLDLVVRVSIVLGLALVAMPLLATRSAAVRRLVLVTALAAAALLPAVPARVMAIHVDAPTAYHQLTGRVVHEPAVEPVGPVGPVGPIGPVAATDPNPWSSVVRLSQGRGLGALGAVTLGVSLVWCIGVLLVGLRFARGIVRAERLARRAVVAPDWDVERLIASARVAGTVTKPARVEVRVSDDVEAPAVAGLFVPVILVPPSSSGWSDERKRAVLLHELAHVTAHDVRAQLLSASVCALYWFNPLAWLVARRLRLERELAADEAVLRAGLRPTTYAEDLLAIAGAAPMGTVAIGEKPLMRRIAAIVATRQPPRLGGPGTALVVGASVTVACAVACTGVSEAPSRSAGAPSPSSTSRSTSAASTSTSAASTSAASTSTSTSVASTSSPSSVVATASAPSSSPSPSPLSPADRDLRGALVSELAQTVERWHAAGGAILVLTPKGEVLAQAGDVDRTVVVGSTMKPLLLAAGFEDGVVSEGDVFESGPGAPQPVSLLLATSNNPGFTRIFERVGGERLGRTLRRFHFATPPQLDASDAIGGTMTATPRQVALAYASLANGGDGIVSTRTAARVTSMLEGVVALDQGTGKKARVEGTRVAGKTGSSEWTTPDAGAASKHTYASFVGYAPADRPSVVIYVGIESPSGPNPWGGEVAAPVFARLLARARP